MKKFFALLLALCMVFALAACGEPAASDPSDAPESEAPADVTEPADEGGDTAESDMAYVQDKGTLVVGILTQPDLFEKCVSNMVEVKSRGAFLMGLTTYGNYSIEDTAGFTVYVPKTDPHFATSLSVIPLQLLAYYVSCAKGLDVDKPRNLAKSVTVE